MKWITFVVAAIAVLSVESRAKADEMGANYYQPGHVGLGVAVQDFSTGATGKVYLKGPFAIQGNLGVGYAYGAGISMSLDGLYEFPNIYGNEDIAMNWYLGLGATIATGSWETGSGALGGGQVIGGYGFQFKKAPVELTAELRPAVLAYGGSSVFYFGAGIAGRYFF